jgi:hypothetical protein
MTGKSSAKSVRVEGHAATSTRAPIASKVETGWKDSRKRSLPICSSAYARPQPEVSPSHSKDGRTASLDPADTIFSTVGTAP